MKKKHLSALLMLTSAYSYDALAEQNESLYSILPDTIAKQELVKLMPGVEREWSIEFNAALIDDDRMEIAFMLPDTGQSVIATRKHFQAYEKNKLQWAGDIVLQDGTAIGEALINVVDGMPFGILAIDGGTYEIHTDDRLGIRLQKVQSTGLLGNHDAEHVDLPGLHESVRTDLFSEKAMLGAETPSISNVDVLVLLDTELQNQPAEIAEIEASFMTANNILRLSGPDGTSPTNPNGLGVPLRLTMRGPEFVDIPDQWEDISLTSDSLARLTDGSNPTSFVVKEKAVNANADYVAIFTDFVPTSVASGVCGKGNIPSSPGADLSFSVSATINSVHCTQSQFVLLHELVHNFGSRHDSDPSDPTVPYVTYARGVTVPESKSNPAFATLMGGCGDAVVDPTTTNCGRLPRLSSPADSHLGIPLGTDGVADNARFLTECASASDCRRGDLASRNALNASIDFVPIPTITSPDDSSGMPTVTETSSFELTADVLDDFPGLEARWEISLHTGVGSGTCLEGCSTGILGTGSNHSYTTSAFSTPGVYRVVLTATDSSSQSRGATAYINVIDSPEALPDPFDDVVNGPRPFDDDGKGRAKLWTDPSVNSVIHNLHDEGDKDWTIIVAEDFAVRVNRFDTSFSPKIKLFRWISAVANPTLGYFEQVNDVFLADSLNSWAVPLKNFATENGTYAVKVVSPGHQQFGDDTEYQLLFEAIPNAIPDAYEFSTLHSDDHEGTPVVWQGATDVVHEQNFHDNNDVDWTMVYTPRFTAEIEEVGPDSDVKITAYRWDDAEFVNGVWINIVKQEVARDWSGSGNPIVSVNTNQADTYLIKVEARNGAFGEGTTYRLRMY